MRSKPGQNLKCFNGRKLRTGTHADAVITCRQRSKGAELRWRESRKGRGGLGGISALGWRGIPKLTIKQNSQGVGCFIKPVVPPKPLVKVTLYLKKQLQIFVKVFFKEAVFIVDYRTFFQYKETFV